ncbi:unnamed protein product [Dracunculus medinensis]|uniref:Lectin_legB domain-containing protein n=1 Tax=Dracunculus medinensis TaxID=318479 RepID=A0A0N4U1E0_DRAME|nr:unnamed protein product [Dracunculus medinensis]
MDIGALCVSVLSDDGALDRSIYFRSNSNDFSLSRISYFTINLGTPNFQLVAKKTYQRTVFKLETETTSKRLLITESILHTGLFFWSPIIFTCISLFGLLRFSEENRIWYLYSPSNAPSHYEHAVANEFFEERGGKFLLELSLAKLEMNPSEKCVKLFLSNI